RPSSVADGGASSASPPPTTSSSPQTGPSTTNGSPPGATRTCTRSTISAPAPSTTGPRTPSASSSTPAGKTAGPRSPPPTSRPPRSAPSSATGPPHASATPPPSPSSPEPTAGRATPSDPRRLRAGAVRAAAGHPRGDERPRLDAAVARRHRRRHRDHQESRGLLPPRPPDDLSGDRRPLPRRRTRRPDRHQ